MPQECCTSFKLTKPVNWTASVSLIIKTALSSITNQQRISSKNHICQTKFQQFHCISQNVHFCTEEEETRWHRLSCCICNNHLCNMSDYTKVYTLRNMVFLSALSLRDGSWFHSTEMLVVISIFQLKSFLFSHTHSSLHAATE